MAGHEIRFRFDERRAAEAASLLLRLSGGRMPRWRLIKLLYLAERAALRRFERPVCGGLYFSMEHGPVLSEVLGLIRETIELPAGKVWRRHFSNEGTLVVLVEPLPPGRLRRGEVAVLEEVYGEFGRLPRDVLGRLVHSLPEYRKTTDRVRRWDIPIDNLLRHLGKTDADLSRIREELKEERIIERAHESLARA